MYLFFKRSFFIEEHKKHVITILLSWRYNSMIGINLLHSLRLLCVLLPELSRSRPAPILFTQSITPSLVCLRELFCFQGPFRNLFSTVNMSGHCADDVKDHPPVPLLTDYLWVASIVTPTWSQYNVSILSPPASVTFVSLKSNYVFNFNGLSYFFPPQRWLKGLASRKFYFINHGRTGRRIANTVIHYLSGITILILSSVKRHCCNSLLKALKEIFCKTTL